MAQTVATTLTTSYVSIAAAGAWSSIQVVGSGDAEIYLGTTPGTLTGFILKNLDGMTPSAFGDDEVYAKIHSGAPVIVVHGV